jgi:hypothetical protein
MLNKGMGNMNRKVKFAGIEWVGEIMLAVVALSVPLITIASFLAL